MAAVSGGPNIEMIDLNLPFALGVYDIFSVRATDLDAVTSYSMRFATDGPNSGFNPTCTNRQLDQTVPAGTTSYLGVKALF